MDLKATALLKLIYLEMFGHDMSWASFNVLEVMSSSKYLQKRVGYLGAVQSFRPDTEVLMLATNLLKKDISSPSIPTISLPLITLPHIITTSLAESLLIDLMPRLTHSNPSIRKKTIVTLYRLALAYPDTLRPAWPKIKDMLMDAEEDPSVTAAVINVVCELGWRRPRDFLPLAPRLFTLLVDGGNNWMAIKIIKLFAILTPLEPRLVKKLLPPLTTLIRTTPAMSLLYECINGIIQGGILEGAQGIDQGDEVAELCVGKLRGMIAVEGDPNLKYVALLAFNKIVTSHSHLVSAHQDVIMSCIDDPDISIRLQALDLSSGMINSDNLTSVVDRLMKQLCEAAVHGNYNANVHEKSPALGVEPAADSDGENPEETLRSSMPNLDDEPAMPDGYRITILRRLLDMCSRDTYANIRDFEWYIEVLVQLVRLVPSATRTSTTALDHSATTTDDVTAISAAIGAELRNVAVRVADVRAEAVSAASSLVMDTGGQCLRANPEGQAVLAYAAWIVGEYATSLSNRQATLNSFLIPTIESFSSDVICAYVQAIPKVLASITSESRRWNAEHLTIISLLLARIINFLEPLTKHPSLEVQERSVEFLELMRLAAEATSCHDPQDDSGPLLLTSGLPSLFSGFELNPVAATAQRRVPLPEGLDLTVPISSKLTAMLVQADQDFHMDTESAESERFYYQRSQSKTYTDLPLQAPSDPLHEPSSYQRETETPADPSLIARLRRERRERNKDDPFYIPPTDEESSGTGTPFHEIIKTSNGQDVDIDSIPIMDLDLGTLSPSTPKTPKPKRSHRQKAHIAVDETLDIDTSTDASTTQLKKGAVALPSRAQKGKKPLLEVDSSGIGSIALSDEGNAPPYGQVELERRELEANEMAKALAEVERLRMEMQRASERIRIAEDIPVEGTLVKRRKKKKRVVGGEGSGVGGAAEEGVEGRVDVPMEAEVVKVKKKRKKVRKVRKVEGKGGGQGEGEGEGAG
ncbi:AP-3 complex subunit delta [Trapelia coarctata]|nr:AP-3 complex subunit delta [Trapelia coarctata]